MFPFESLITLPVVLFLVTLAFGFWTSRAGRPLNVILFTVHKLSALAAVILAARALWTWLPGAGVGVVLAVILGVCALSLFITGAFLSREKPVSRALKMAHQSAQWVAVLAAAGLIYAYIG